MCTRTQDRQGTPARSASKNVTSQGTSYLCIRCSHWVHSRCSGLRNAADYRKANGWICTTRMTTPQPPSPSHSPAHHVRQDVQHTTVERQWYGQRSDGTKHLPRGVQRQSGGHSAKITTKSRSPNIQNYTLVRQDQCQGPGGGLLFFIHKSVSFTRKPLSTMSKNDLHLEELTISIAMDITELLITNVYIPQPVPAMSVIHHQLTTC